MRKRIKPSAESLESRVQPSAMVLDYPWNVVGPIPAGSYRELSPAAVA